MLATNWENRHLPLDASIYENERPVILKSLHLVLGSVPFYNFNRVAVVEISRLPSRIDVHTVFRSLDEMAIRFDTNRSNHRFFTHLTKLFPISIIFTLLSTISSNLRNNTTIDNFVFYVVEAATTKFGSDLFDQVAIISSFLFFSFLWLWSFFMTGRYYYFCRSYKLCLFRWKTLERLLNHSVHGEMFIMKVVGYARRHFIYGINKFFLHHVKLLKRRLSALLLCRIF